MRRGTPARRYGWRMIGNCTASFWRDSLHTRRTRWKNRIHGTLARHNLQVQGADLFGVAARRQLGTRLPELPAHSREAVEQELATLDFLKTQIDSAEQRLEAIMSVSAEADLLKTLPCVGTVLSMVLM